MSRRTLYTQGTRSSAPKRIRSLPLGTGGGLPADPHLCLSHDTPDVPTYVEMVRNVQYRKLPIPPPNPGDAEELWESRRRQIRKSKFACTQRQDIPAERSHEVPKETIKGVSSLSPCEGWGRGVLKGPGEHLQVGMPRLGHTLIQRWLLGHWMGLRKGGGGRRGEVVYRSLWRPAAGTGMGLGPLSLLF